MIISFCIGDDEFYILIEFPRDMILPLHQLVPHQTKVHWTTNIQRIVLKEREVEGERGTEGGRERGRERGRKGGWVGGRENDRVSSRGD